MQLKRGLFWKTKSIEGEDKFLSVAVAHKIGEEYQPLNHKEEWTKLPKQITQGKPFDYFPRGRVEIRNIKAIIFLNPILHTNDFVAKVLEHFGLTKENGIAEVQIKADNSYHYQYKDEI